MSGHCVCTNDDMLGHLGNMHGICPMSDYISSSATGRDPIAWQQWTGANQQSEAGRGACWQPELQATHAQCNSRCPLASIPYAPHAYWHRKTAGDGRWHQLEADESWWQLARRPLASVTSGIAHSLHAGICIVHCDRDRRQYSLTCSRWAGFKTPPMRRQDDPKHWQQKDVEVMG